MQVKFITGADINQVEVLLNEFLETLSETPTIKYDLNNLTVIVEYTTIRNGAICCECRHWDEYSGDGLMGMCQMCGQRKRFSSKCCSKYADVRG